ncbi:amidase signature domain-containing protein [Alternaria rosae]|uniref:amidase signature domain-containing protein n=1 Tax=Alternaria rosae TaxID=1187941 RepID=UPI001E8CB794|nr:amidase signature domain-containing protein [Alternaria rosae]KAH6872313.1 amidase signature domain-containing protein [Alternaria rosae]
MLRSLRRSVFSSLHRPNLRSTMSTFPTATLTRVGTIPYYVPSSLAPIPADSRRLIFGNAPDFSDGPLPISLLVFEDATHASHSVLSSTVNSWLQTDDVFNADFLQHVYFLFLTQTDAFDLDESSIGILNDWKTQSVHAVSVNSTAHDDSFRGGPYFASNVGIREAWRLFEDANEAFQFPVVPDEHRDNTFNIPGTAAVPVPSRCYYDRPSNTKPLSGMRIAIKDNIDLKGVRTSAGNRAYQALYAEKARSAVCVEKLIEAGAVIVGKTKTVQFASGENARDWIDFFPPFSPRGDGYQDPGCSSAGSATAASAYDWIDATLGTDTFGSVVGPAADHGVFGLRPSLGSISTEGTVPVSKLIDTVGFFTRSIQIATALSRTLGARDITSNLCAASIELLYPTDVFSGSDEMYLSHIEPFIRHLEEFLQAKRKKLDVDGLFRQQAVVGGSSLKEYLDTTVAHIQLYDCYQNCLPFLRDYKQIFHKKAFADPYIEYKWSLGKNLTVEQYEQAVKERNTFGDWMRTAILPQPSDGKTLDKILIFPNGDTEPFDRHEYLKRSLEEGASKKQGFGYKPNVMAVLAGLPFFTIPYGQYPYKSAVTGNVEYLPGAIAVVGPQGSESAMLELLQEFLERTPEMRDTVLTGPTSFPVDHKASPSL